MTVTLIYMVSKMLFPHIPASMQSSSQCLCRIYFVGVPIASHGTASVGTPYSCRTVVAPPHPPRLTLFRPSQGQSHFYIFFMFCLILFLFSNITFVHCIQLTVPYIQQHLVLKWSQDLVPCVMVCHAWCTLLKKSVRLKIPNLKVPSHTVWMRSSDV